VLLVPDHWTGLLQGLPDIDVCDGARIGSQFVGVQAQVIYEEAHIIAYMKSTIIKELASNFLA